MVIYETTPEFKRRVARLIANVKLADLSTKDVAEHAGISYNSFNYLLKGRYSDELANKRMDEFEAYVDGVLAGKNIDPI